MHWWARPRLELYSRNGRYLIRKPGAIWRRSSRKTVAGLYSTARQEDQTTARRCTSIARRNPDWFCERLTADETGVFTPEQLERIEQEYIGLHGEDHGRSIFQQEYMCSFTAAVLGTYYGAEMAAAERQGRICGVPYDPAARVTTAWDLGIGDSTAIWFMQRVGKEIHLIDYYEASGQGLVHYVKVIEQRGYFYDRHILPHDVQARELGIGKTRLEHLEGLGLRSGMHGRIDIAPRQQDEEGISAARMLLPKCWFDAVKCRKGIEALKLFRTEWDQDKRVFRRKALHDWTSHAADAFAYLAMTIDSGAPAGFGRKLTYENLALA
jgi:phage terminase large subunit